MKEQFRSNEKLLTTLPFPPTLGRERNIFMAEPGNGEGQAASSGSASRPHEVGKTVPTQRAEMINKGWDDWTTNYLKEQGRPSLRFEERQGVEAAKKAGRLPYSAAGAQGEVDEATMILEEAARRGREFQERQLRQRTAASQPQPEGAASDAAGEGEGGGGEPPRTATGAPEEPEPEPEEGAGEGEEVSGNMERDIVVRAERLVEIVESGRPDAYDRIDQIIDVQNSNDQRYGIFIERTTQRLIENIERNRQNNIETSRETINAIEYLFEYATERILSRADVSPKAQYPQFGFYENINLDSIISMARIYDHSMRRSEGAEGTVFKYLDDLRGRRHIMHELFRNMKERRAYVSYITQNLRKEGLAFVEKEIAGVADSQIIYEKFLGSALSFKEGWLTAADLEAVDRNVEGFMTRNAEEFRKEIRDENGQVVHSRPLRPWELKRAAIVGKSLNAAMQRRIVYTVLGDVPSDDIDTLLDSVDAEHLARILAPMKLITERFLGIDTNTRKIFIEELLKKTKELGANAKELGGAHNQYFGYLSRDEKGEIIRDKEGKEKRQGLYGKRENSWAILDTGITDPKSNSWRGRKMFLKQNDYRTETLEGEALSIGEYIDRVRSEEGKKIEERVRRRYLNKNKSDIQIGNIMDSSKYAGELRVNFNNTVKEVIQKQRLFLGPLLQMQTDRLDEGNKQIIWEKVAELLPSRIAAFFPEETIEKIQDTYGFRPAQNATAEQKKEARARALVIWNGIPAMPGRGGIPETEAVLGIKTKLFLAESKRVADDAKTIKGKKWDEVGQLRNLSSYFDEVGIDESERLIIGRITNLGKKKTKENPQGKAQELASIKFPFTPFLDDVPKTDWENIDDVSYDRILVQDHSDFQEGYSAVIGLMGKPIVEPKTVVEAFAKAVEKIQGPLGLKGPNGAQRTIEKDISAYLSMARESGLAKIFGPVMKLGRIPRSKMEEGNLQAGIVFNEDFTSSVLQGIAQGDVISDDPAEKDKKGLTQFSRMKKENKADMKWKLLYWARMILLIFGPIAGAEFIKVMLPREAAETVLAGF